MKTLIVAGGGTGGHVLAGVAVADTWRQLSGNDCRVIFVGAQAGIEERLVPRAGYPLELLKLGALNRVGIIRQVKTLFLIPMALFKSLRILLKYRPQAVLGVGGYASGPLVLMARFMIGMGIQTAILEQNSVPGMTNRILGRFVHRVFCAFPGTEKSFPAGKAIVTGNPIRLTMKPMKAAPAEPFVVFAFGGSQGAVGINTLILDALPHLHDLKGEIKFIHQTGEKDHARVVEGFAKAGFEARVEKFIYDMPEVYESASLLVCRAGSSTLSEIAAIGRAAVLVPFPFASDNHQEVNARVFSGAGAALLMPQFGSRGEDLARVIRDLKSNTGKLRAMEASVRVFYKPQAAGEIAQALAVV